MRLASAYFQTTVRNEQPIRGFDDGKRVTLKDIAAHTRLSIAAVSMALRQHPSIPAATRARVKALADSLGYAPDPMLGALAVYRNRMRPRRVLSVVALVSNWNTRDGWLRLPGMKRVLASAEERAAAMGYQIQHFWAKEHGIGPTRLNRILAARGIRGVLLVPPQEREENCILDRTMFSLVALDHSATDCDLPHIGTNHYSNILRCWRELRARGYSRVGLVTNSQQTQWSENQCEAAHTFIQAQHAAPRDYVPTLSLTAGSLCEQIRTR